MFNLGDEVRKDNDTLIGQIPLTNVVRRFAPGFGFTGCVIHTESGNDIEPSSNQDINTIVVDNTDPNLIYHEGERIYSMIHFTEPKSQSIHLLKIRPPSQ